MEDMNFPQKFPFGSKRLFLLQFGPKTVSLSILKWAPGICLKLALIMKRQESKNMKCFRKPLVRSNGPFLHPKLGSNHPILDS